MSVKSNPPLFFETGRTAAEAAGGVVCENSSSACRSERMCSTGSALAFLSKPEASASPDERDERILSAAVADSLEARRQALLERYRSLRKEAAARVQQLVDAFGLTADDVRLRSGATAHRVDASAEREDDPRRLPAKYRGPHGEAWSGRGKLPLWLRRELERGASREDFLVRGK